MSRVVVSLATLPLTVTFSLPFTATLLSLAAAVVHDELNTSTRTVVDTNPPDWQQQTTPVIVWLVVLLRSPQHGLLH